MPKYGLPNNHWLNIKQKWLLFILSASSPFKIVYSINVGVYSMLVCIKIIFFSISISKKQISGG